MDGLAISGPVLVAPTERAFGILHLWKPAEYDIDRPADLPGVWAMSTPKVSVEPTGRRRHGFEEFRVRYGGVLPDALIWLPDAMGAEILEDMIRDAQEPA